LGRRLYPPAGFALPGNLEALPGNLEALPGNLEALPGNLEALPGNLEALPGKPEALPGKPEAIPGNLEALPGNLEALPGKPEALPGNLEALPGNPEALPGKPEAIPGNLEARPGNSEAIPGNLEARPGNPEARPGNLEARPGNPEALPGNPKARPGNSEALPGKPEARPGNSEARPGNSEAIPGNLEALPKKPRSYETRRIRKIHPGTVITHKRVERKTKQLASSPETPYKEARIDVVDAIGIAPIRTARISNSPRTPASQQIPAHKAGAPAKRIKTVTYNLGVPKICRPRTWARLIPITSIDKGVVISPSIFRGKYKTSGREIEKINKPNPPKAAPTIGLIKVLQVIASPRRPAFAISPAPTE
jgi:hypothetical protein